MPNLSVVFGAGPLARAVARELTARGRSVRLLSRRGRAVDILGVESVAGDACSPETLRSVCEGAAVVYHCASPPYTRWVADFPALQRGILECARQAGARLVFGDNLYMYGPVAGPLKEDLPARAAGPNGRIRAEMADLLMEAHAKGTVRVAIGRGSDFYGPGVLGSHIGERVFGLALQGKPAQLVFPPDQPHTVTYIRDFARALVTLGEDERSMGKVWHVPNQETLTLREFIGRVYAAAGRRPQIQVLPRFVVAGMALVNPLLRALREQSYQFEKPFVVDHSAFVGTFGDISTPLADAIRETLEWFRERPW